MQTFSKPQLLALLAAARAHSEGAWLMVLTGYHFGLRASEVVAIKREDVRDGFLSVKRLKGSNPTCQRVPDHGEPLLSLREPFLSYVQLQPFGTPIFPVGRKQFWRLMQTFGERAGIPAHLNHPHNLKHAIAMHTIEKAGIERLRRHLGHKSIASTGEYLKVTDDEASNAIADALR